MLLDEVVAVLFEALAMPRRHHPISTWGGEQKASGYTPANEQGTQETIKRYDAPIKTQWSASDQNEEICQQEVSQATDRHGRRSGLLPRRRSAAPSETFPPTGARNLGDPAGVLAPGSRLVVPNLTKQIEGGFP